MQQEAARFDMTVQCCKCKRIRHDREWVETDGARPLGLVSHGYCPTCAEQAFAEVERLCPAPTPIATAS